STVTFPPWFLPSATAWSARYVGVQTLPGSICRCRVYRAPAAIAAPMRRPASASLASLASTTTSTASTSTRGSSPACLRSVKIQAPCAAPSTASWPQSRALTPPRASAATSSATLLAPSTRARLAATAAARRRLVRVTSALLPIPTMSRRWILPAAGYSSWVSSRLPLKSPPAIARAIIPPVARSRAASDAGTVVPVGTITARRGVSRSPAGVVTMALFMGCAGLSPPRRRRSRRRGRHAEAAHLGRAGVGEIVAVEIRRGDDGVLVGAQQHLLEHGVGDAVLDDDLPRGAARLLSLVQGAVVEALPGDLVAPVAEGALGELNYVDFVHVGYCRPDAVES